MNGHPRNTIAGSTTSTLRIESRLATSTITNTAAAVITSTCQGMKKASRVAPFTTQPKIAARPTPEPVADQPHLEPLGEHHQQDRPVARAHRLEGPELADVLDGEQIEGLAGDRRADEKAEQHGDPEVDRDAGLLQVVIGSSSR